MGLMDTMEQHVNQFGGNLPTEGNVMLLLMSSQKNFEFVIKFLELWVCEQMNMVEHVNVKADESRRVKSPFQSDVDSLLITCYKKFQNNSTSNVNWKVEV